MSLTNNPNELKWVDEMIALTKPDKVVWIDGSAEQLQALRDEALSTGEMVALNQEKLPGCIYHRTDPTDVARVEDRTFICSINKEDAGPTNNWCDPKEMYAKLTPMYDGSMKGRTMYVIPYSMGPIGSPLAKVGVYVPGGKAAYPSSVLMNVLPAKVAGCKSITMVTPAVGGKLNNLVLAAAYVCEVDNVYKIGGAQAIAALAYGTESIERVDKIVGPGNIFVALAKREVYGLVGIDSIAGPSEICIIGDKTSNAKYTAADLLGQAEHDELASSTLFITDYDKSV